MVKLAPGSLANDAGLRLGVICEVLNLFVCPLITYLMMLVCFVCLRCMSNRTCAQHKLLCVVLILEMCQ